MDSEETWFSHSLPGPACKTQQQDRPYLPLSHATPLQPHGLWLGIFRAPLAESFTRPRATPIPSVRGPGMTVNGLLVVSSDHCLTHPDQPVT